MQVGHYFSENLPGRRRAPRRSVLSLRPFVSVTQQNCTQFAVLMAKCMDYGRTMKPFFKDIPKFWANWADWPNEFCGIWHLSRIFIIQLFFSTKKFACFSDLTQIYPRYDLVEKNLENSHHTSVVGVKMYAKHLLKRVLYCRKFCSRGPTYSSQPDPSHPCHRSGPQEPGGLQGWGGALPSPRFQQII